MRNKFFLSGGIMLNSGFLSFDWSVMSSVMHPFTDLLLLTLTQQVKQTRAKLGSTLVAVFVLRLPLLAPFPTYVTPPS